MTFVGLAVLSEFAVTEDAPDFRTLSATTDVWLLESREIRKKLELTDQQTSQINALLDDWKVIHLKAMANQRAGTVDEGRSERKEKIRLPITSLTNSIYEVLDDEQFQKFVQMRLLWTMGPVWSGDATRFKELEISADQHRQLHALNIKWVLLGLAELKGQYRAQRPGVKAAPGQRRFSEFLTYRRNQALLAWKVKPIRDAEWSRILTPAQARRWKELELQSTFALDPFVVMVSDYASREQGRIPQTGKTDDYFVPYFTPPASVLGLGNESRQQIQKLISGNTLYGTIGSRDGVTGLANHLVTIDTSTLEVTDVGFLGVSAGVSGGLAYDVNTDQLYMMASNNTNLFTVDPNTGQSTVVGDVGEGTFWRALEFAIDPVTIPPEPPAPPVPPVTAQVGDTIMTGAGNDTVIAGDGDDVIIANGGNESISGNGGNDSILAGSGADTIDGGDGDDTLDGQGGNDILRTGLGQDVIVWDGVPDGTDVIESADGAQALIVNGTSGSDSFTVDSNGGFLRVSSGAASITVSDVTNEVSLLAGAGTDTITVSSLNDVRPVSLVVDGQADNDTISATGSLIGSVILELNGGAGDDTITGSRGAETLDGGDGDDLLFGGEGNDSLTGNNGADTLNGEAGDDSLTGGLGEDVINGGDGNDFADGGFQDDTLSGNNGSDSLLGGFGDDVLNGGAGDDLVDGEQDNDTVQGGAGADSLDGGTGDDVVRGQSGPDQIKGNDGNDRIFGDGGNDTIDAGDGDDTIDAGNGNDIIAGGDGNDSVNGMSGRDTLIGGNGNDTLLGGGGSDQIFGGEGSDVLRGNGSTDRFNSGEAGQTPKDLDAGETDDMNLVIQASVLQALAALDNF